jgi:hypothetical protein
MWLLHTELAQETLSQALPSLLAVTDEVAVGELLSHACYTGEAF